MPKNTQPAKNLKNLKNLKMTLSCLKHVKRIPDTDTGKLERPPAPPVINVLEVILDRSGSMKSLGDIPREGLENFMSEQQRFAKETGAKTYVSLTTFDTTAETYYDAVDITTIPLPFTDAQMRVMVQPRDCTRLVDTMMERLMAINHKIAAIVREQPKEVRTLKPKISATVVGITDGQDNMSQQWTPRDLNILISKMKSKGIEVLFLASNQDAITTGMTFGIQQQNAQTFGNNQRQARAAYKSASAACCRAASGSAPAFTQREQQATAPAAFPHYGGINDDSDDDYDSDDDDAAAVPQPTWLAAPPRANRGARWYPLPGSALNYQHPAAAAAAAAGGINLSQSPTTPLVGGGGATPRAPSINLMPPPRPRMRQTNTVAAYHN
jgi:hypothetical protein